MKTKSNGSSGCDSLQILGIGPGNYEFGYIPFQNSAFRNAESTEESVVQYPHNGYTEALAENGLFFTITLVTLIAWLLTKLFASQQQKPDFTGKLLQLVYFLTTALTAFPMENGYPCYVVALSIGLLFAVTYKESIRLTF